MRAEPILLAAVTGLLCGACITTPASETGWSKKAHTLVPVECGPDATIEDGEDGDTRSLQREGRGGYWYTFADPEGSTIQPNPFKMEQPGRNGSKYAAHMHGKVMPSGPSLYVGMAFALADPRGAYDASRYKGIVFWAKGPGHVRFKLADAYTSPEGGFCKDCYNHNGMELALTSEWARYTLPFEWLSQRQGWGDPRPGVAQDRLYAIEFQFDSAGKSYDIWVDDIAFFCGTQGGTP